MNAQISETIQTTEYSTVHEMVKRIQETRGAYIADGDIAQFVVLPIEEFERLERTQKRLMLREEYLRTLINEGYTTEKLQELLSELDLADSRWLIDPERERNKLFQFTEHSFRTYSANQGLDYDSLDDESFSDLADNLIHKARKASYDVEDCG